MKLTKIISAVLVCILLAGGIYFDTHYVKIDSRTYKKDVDQIHFVSLDKHDHIRQINKCTALEDLFITDTSENRISRLKNLDNLTYLTIGRGSKISNTDCEKISNFNNLRILNICTYSFIDFKKLNNIENLTLQNSSAVNIESLSECPSLKSITIADSTVDNFFIAEDGKPIMKDSSVFSSFDYLEELSLDINEIEDISGILEMDSLKTLKINKGTLSGGDKKLLEEKGVSVVESD